MLQMSRVTSLRHVLANCGPKIRGKQSQNNQEYQDTIALLACDTSLLQDSRARGSNYGNIPRYIFKAVVFTRLIR